MLVWFVQPWPRFETSLELAQTHLDRGDDVEFFVCNGEMNGCWLNYTHFASVCSKCRAVRDLSISLLSPRPKVQSFLKLRPSDVEELRSLKDEFADLETLKTYCVDGFDVGMAVASGLITTVRDPHLDVRSHAETIRRSMTSTWAMYRSMQNHLDDKKPDCVYVANARGAEARSVLRACQSRGVTCLVHETGHDQDHYEIYPNSLPHDIKVAVRKIADAWEAADPDERERVANEWYRRRAAATGSSEPTTYVGEQHVGLLPDGFASSRRNVAVFNSSEDELACLEEEWNNPLYGNQLDGLRKLAGSLVGIVNPPRVYVRLHPNLRDVETEELRVVKKLHRPGFEIIPPESPVSSYDLMRQCDTVLTFGSTVGIEAVFWGKPSVLAGSCWYRNLGGTYNPATHDELVNLLLRPLEPKDRNAALQYGYYMATFGKPFRYYEPEQPMMTHFAVSGRFKGRYLRPSRRLQYFWAIINRIRPLSAWLDDRNLRDAERKLALAKR